MRLPLVNDNFNHEQAAIMLRSIWDAQNTIEKQQWQAQLDNERQDVERQGELEAELRRKEEESAKAKEEALQEEIKKNKMKYTPIPKRGVPSHPLIIPAISAVQKMDKGEYVLIWYYTKAGLKNAKYFAVIDNDALTLVTNSNSTTMAIPATSSRDAKGMVEDHDLTMEQFQIGAMQMLTAMKQANWPTDCIHMMEAFWMNIMDHPYQTSLDEQDQLALLLYQSEQWKQWFQTINSPAYAYDLQEINEEVLRDAKEHVRYSLLKREDKKCTAEAVEGLISTDLTFSSFYVADEYLPIFCPFTYITPSSYTLQTLLGCIPTFAPVLILVAVLPLCTKNHM